MVTFFIEGLRHLHQVGTVNPTTNVFRPAPEPGMLHAGSKGVAVYKLICCVAVVVAGGSPRA